MDLIGKILEEMLSDDSMTEKENEIIMDEYVNSTEDERKKIDRIFIALCGWSLKSLIEDYVEIN